MRSRVITAVLACAVAVALSGCSDDKDAKDNKDEPSSASDQGVPSVGETTDGGESSTEPSVAAATGPVIEVDALSMHLTDRDDWVIGPGGGIVASAVLDLDEGLFEVRISSTNAPDDITVDQDAQLSQEGRSHEDPAPQRVENREIGGVECWVLEGENDTHRTYVVGGPHDESTFSIHVNYPVAVADAEQWIEEMLASVEWKAPTG